MIRPLEKGLVHSRAPAYLTDSSPPSGEDGRATSRFACGDSLAEWGSNPPQSRLTAECARQECYLPMVRVERFELSTSRVRGGRASKLRYTL